MLAEGGGDWRSSELKPSERRAARLSWSTALLVGGSISLWNVDCLYRASSNHLPPSCFSLFVYVFYSVTLKVSYSRFCQLRVVVFTKWDLIGNYQAQENWGVRAESPAGHNRNRWVKSV